MARLLLSDGRTSIALWEIAQMKRIRCLLAACFGFLILDAAVAQRGGVIDNGEDDGGVTSELKGAPGQGSKPQLYRLKLKNGDRYLDHGCGRQVSVKSGGQRGNRCQLWQAVQQGKGWYRLQAAGTALYLDADHCTAKVGLSGLSDWENGACQAWRLMGRQGEWSRLQLRHGGQYLDSSYCKEVVAMHPGSDYDGGSCQLWRLVPE